jgi:uncharacterized membrane protein YtjA (UPF0391 family)
MGERKSVGEEEGPAQAYGDDGADQRRDEDKDDATADDAAASLDRSGFVLHGSLRWGLRKEERPLAQAVAGSSRFCRLDPSLAPPEPRAQGRVITPRLSVADRTKERAMLYWALMFLLIALVAAVFGFGGIASTAAGIAQILFVVALVLFVLSVFMGLRRRNL